MKFLTPLFWLRLNFLLRALAGRRYLNPFKAAYHDLEISYE
ncbi:hypothetical protein HCUR_01027 [Holospora curviuscula]|uniref:Uncharacterized protein n=1 Tax=Holospora curviuscula TaxID=1082868 RepID=A0A2S5R846_9PROT|nr:hypothetical protein HCUR_01027 [Holospora curviuscula]